MAYERLGGRTMGTIWGWWKRKVGKLALIMLDIGAKICDNDHTVDGAYDDVLGQSWRRRRPISFLS